LRGRLCSEYSFSTRVPLGTGRAEAVLVRGVAWIARSGAGLAEYLEFHRGAGERGLIFSNAGARDHGDGRLALALARGRTELDRRIVAVGGMPWAVDLRIKPEKATVWGRLDRRFRGKLRTQTIAVTTDTVPRQAFAVPSGWRTVSGGEGGLYQQVRDDPGKGRIRFLGRRLWLGVGMSLSGPEPGEVGGTFASAAWRPAIRLVGPLARQGLSLSVAPVFRHYRTPDLRVRVLALTAGPRYDLVSPRKSLVPFVALRAGPYFVSLQGSDTRLRPGAAVESGVSIRRRFVLSGSYELLPRTKGVDLANWSLNAIVRIY
jgi:hypothetical protein